MKFHNHCHANKGHFEVCTFLIQKMKDKNPKDSNGCTPFHIAAKNGHHKICHLIMENAEEKNPSDENGTTPLHIASKNGNLLICELILKKISNKYPTDKSGKTPLQMAVENGHPELDFRRLFNDFGDITVPKELYGSKQNSKSVHHKESVPRRCQQVLTL